MWELFTRLLWLPLDMIQRVSHRFLHFGRSVYGTLFGQTLKPAIKPKEPPTKSPPRNNSPSLPLKELPCNSFITPQQASVSAYVIDMEIPTDITSTVEEQNPLFVLETSTLTQTTVSKCSSSVATETFETELCNLEIPGKTIQKTTDIVNDVMGNTANTAVMEQQQQQPHVCAETHSSVAVADDDDKSFAAEVVMVEGEAQDSFTYCINCAAPHANTETCAVRGNKRFRETEKRRQITMPNISDADADSANLSSNGCMLHHDTEAHAKKPKLSVENSDESPLVPPQNAPAGPLVKEKVKQSKKKRPKKNKKGEIQGEPQEGDKMGIRAPPPNFFIAVQISNKEILSKVAQLQKSWTEQQLSPPWHDLTNTEIFKDAMVPVAKLHFTLHVMHLKGSEDIEKAQSALAECSSIVHQEFVDDPMDLTIEGLGHFKNNVIFAQIKHKSHIARLTRLAELFRKKFTELNIPVDPRPFNPHMTLAKISRSNKLYKKKIRSFPPDMWSACGQTNLGTQRISGIQLLQMAGEDKATGYYVCLGQYFFEDPLVITKPHKTSKDDDKADGSYTTV